LFALIFAGKNSPLAEADDATLPQLSHDAGLRAYRLYKGMPGRIAKNLGVHQSTVSNVLSGTGKSARIDEAIKDELEGICLILCDPNFTAPLKSIKIYNQKSSNRGPKVVVSPLTPEERHAFRFRGKYYGIVSRMARQLGMGRSNLSAICLGKVPGSKALAAIRDEMRRIDALGTPSVPPPTQPLTEAERKLFGRGQRYFGLAVLISKRLNLSVGHVYGVCSGVTTSERTLRELRAAMAKRDAEHAAKQVSK
jgi:hypothetical protein